MKNKLGLRTLFTSTALATFLFLSACKNEESEINTLAEPDAIKKIIPPPNFDDLIPATEIFSSKPYSDIRNNWFGHAPNITVSNDLKLTHFNESLDSAIQNHSSPDGLIHYFFAKEGAVSGRYFDSQVIGNIRDSQLNGYALFIDSLGRQYPKYCKDGKVLEHAPEVEEANPITMPDGSVFHGKTSYDGTRPLGEGEVDYNDGSTFHGNVGAYGTSGYGIRIWSDGSFVASSNWNVFPNGHTIYGDPEGNIYDGTYSRESYSLEIKHEKIVDGELVMETDSINIPSLSIAPENTNFPHPAH